MSRRSYNTGFFILLGSLIVLGLPALILLIFFLVGKGNALNSWLRAKMALSSNLSLPLWAGLIILLLPLILLLLYFLKLKRKPLVVPSTFLWRQTVDDTQVNSFFQWLKRNWLLLIQLATLFFIIYALLGLQLFGEPRVGKHYVILIDNSASMSATDVQPNRLELAKATALEVIDSHDKNDFGLVVVFNSRGTVLQSWTDDRELLRRAVRSIKPTQRVTQIQDALEKASGRANPIRTTDDTASSPADVDPSKQRTYVAAEGIATDVHLFSDGGFADIADYSLGKSNVVYHRIGEIKKWNNVGIVSVNAKRADKDPTQLNVFGHVHNYFDKKQRIRAQLGITINGRLTDVKETVINCQPRKSRTVGQGKKQEVIVDPGTGNFQFLVPKVQRTANVVLRVYLPDVRDHFPTDNQAWLTVGVVRKSRVLLVTEGNRYLDSFLGSAEDQGLVTYDTLEPADLKDANKYRTPAIEGQWDLVIFDDCTVPEKKELPFANAMFVNSLPPPWDKLKREPLKETEILGWLSDYSLFQNLTGLQDVTVLEAFHFDVSKQKETRGAPRLLEVRDSKSLMTTLPYGPFTHLILTFPLKRANGKANGTFPTDLRFPLFMLNVLFTYGNISGDESIRPGEVKQIYPSEVLKEIRVKSPSGGTTKLTRDTQPYFDYGETEEPGAYATIRKDGRLLRYFAVNLLDSQESNLQPRTSFSVGARQVVEGEARRLPRNLWKWLVAVALFLLLGEWYLYNRRF